MFLTCWFIEGQSFRLVYKARPLLTANLRLHHSLWSVSSLASLTLTVCESVCQSQNGWNRDVAGNKRAADLERLEEVVCTERIKSRSWRKTQNTCRDVDETQIQMPRMWSVLTQILSIQYSDALSSLSLLSEIIKISIWRLNRKQRCLVSCFLDL